MRFVQLIFFVQFSSFLQLVAADILFHGVLEESSGSPNIILLDYPTPTGCNKKDFGMFKGQILNSTMHLDVELSQWIVTYSFKRPSTESCKDVQYKGISFDYSLQCAGGNQEKKESFLADRIMSDLKGLFRLYKHAINVDQYLKGKTCIFLRFRKKVKVT